MIISIKTLQVTGNVFPYSCNYGNGSITWIVNVATLPTFSSHIKTGTFKYSILEVTKQIFVEECFLD